jgi:hypothetical protein
MKVQITVDDALCIGCVAASYYPGNQIIIVHPVTGLQNDDISIVGRHIQHHSELRQLAQQIWQHRLLLQINGDRRFSLFADAFFDATAYCTAHAVDAYVAQKKPTRY